MTMTHPTPPHRAAFTILELLIVLVVIGLVAALVLPKFGDVKEEAYLSAMKNDLRNVVPAQEIFQAENSAYASTPSELDMGTTEDVSLDFREITSGRYVAIASHKKTERRCQVSHNANLVTDRRVLCQREERLPERASVWAEINPFLSSGSETFTFTGKIGSLGDTPIASWEWKIWDIDIPSDGEWEYWDIDTQNCVPTDPTKSLVASGTGRTFSATLDDLDSGRQYWTGVFARHESGRTACWGIGSPRIF